MNDLEALEAEGYSIGYEFAMGLVSMRVVRFKGRYVSRAISYEEALEIIGWHQEDDQKSEWRRAQEAQADVLR